MAVAAQTSAVAPSAPATRVPVNASASGPASAPKVSREEIAAIVDRFLANRQPEPSASPLPSPPSGQPPPPPRQVQPSAPSGGATNGRKAADFVSEDDVKQAILKGEKIYVGPKTIITPSARDIGEPAEIFAKA